MIVSNLRFVQGVFALLCCVLCSYGQQQLKGKVVDDATSPIYGATVRVLRANSTGTTTSVDGSFMVQLPIGTHKIQVSYIGFTTHIAEVKISETPPPVLQITLSPSVEELQGVTIRSKTEAERVQEQAFEIDVIDTRGIKNVSVDVNSLLNTVPGVVVRENGGLGADFTFSLNGFSGHQVKFFIDGIPQDNLGTSLSFNNFPATLIERAEVYKGVVPIYLGADALGGAINLLTHQKKETFLDLSLDTGSFNTQRATLNGRYYTPKGVMLGITSFFNHSDNDYKIYGNEFGKEGFAIRDALGNETGERKAYVKRFHDQYTSGMVSLKAGVVDKSYADRLMINAVWAANTNAIQHGTSPQIPFGAVERKEEAKRLSIQYAKDSIFGTALQTKVYAEYAEVESKIIDTASTVYAWFGNTTPRLNIGLGESGGSKTLFQFNDQRAIITTSLLYKLHTNQQLALNYTKNYLERQGEDPISVIPIAFEDPRTIDKNILGLSYTLKTMENTLATTVFGKGFFINMNSVLEDEFENDPSMRFEDIRKSYQKMGFGAAVSYKITSQLQLKTSFENTFRVPEGFEFFGDGLNLLPNPNLEPEESTNINVGFLWRYASDAIRLVVDMHGFRRAVTNRLFLLSRGIKGQYINLNNVTTLGMDSAVQLTAFERAYLKVSGTYQYISNTATNERLANQPYLFGNLELGYHFEGITKLEDRLECSWQTSFTEEFPFQSFTAAAEDQRFIVPSQLSHTVQLGYHLLRNRYHISLQVRNLTNARLFDNLNIQKPGRAFFLKLRYYLNNS